MVNKAILMRAINKSTGLPLREASLCIDVVMETIKDGLLCGKRIELRGLGSFTVKKVAAKKLSFANAAANIVPAHGKIVFRPCQKLKESVWSLTAKTVHGLEREASD